MDTNGLDFDAHWQTLSTEVIARIQEWQRQHREATLQAIEVAVQSAAVEPRSVSSA
jgi:hypothetical protein